MCIRDSLSYTRSPGEARDRICRALGIGRAASPLGKKFNEVFQMGDVGRSAAALHHEEQHTVEDEHCGHGDVVIEVSLQMCIRDRLYVLQGRKVCCEAANWRNEKKALSAATSFFPFRLLHISVCKSSIKSPVLHIFF